MVQLNNNYNLKYLYGPDYGYRTGINKTMTNHMKNIRDNLLSKIKLKKNDCILDIASNDGTLLNSFNIHYKPNFDKLGHMFLICSHIHQLHFVMHKKDQQSIQY